MEIASDLHSYFKGIMGFHFILNTIMYLFYQEQQANTGDMLIIESPFFLPPASILPIQGRL